MAKKKSKKAAKKSPAKKAPKKAVKKAVKRTAPKAKAKTRAKAKTVRKPARKAAPARKPLKKKTLARKAAPKPKAASKKLKAISKKPAARKPAPKPAPKVAKKTAPKPKPKAAAPAVPARLMRERKRLPEVEQEEFSGSGADARLLSSARSGHDELRSELRDHTEAGPELTAGDVDAKWQDAYALGDEAPGGDNMTPDQDRVDDIGKALGVVYDDDEELMGGDEIAERDAHRWELDPASKDDEEI